ncbi:hypothetical protein FPCIR_3326 [Fusarium pseudocircinatum]|uniref:Fungal N-terminal domain-containing protein n=1 Tax=Fusarium pseudocircinatum TaxID=56676 RepID=A0A8H5UTX2_9HYPO|nr:hypothetical protein FPCIR_3326 [Fusarium pseudocircinatum]
MAEPVGITGTAIGIVSFGLQLYTGISKYLDAVKGRDEDLKYAKQHTNILRDYLSSLEETLQTIGSDSTVARHAVERFPALKLCSFYNVRKIYGAYAMLYLIYAKARRQILARRNLLYWWAKAVTNPQPINSAIAQQGTASGAKDSAWEFFSTSRRPKRLPITPQSVSCQDLSL